MNEMPEDIVRLILLSCKRDLSGEERRQVEEWMEAHPGQWEQMRQLERYAGVGDTMKIYEGIDVRSAWKQVDGKTGRHPGWRQRRIYSRWWVAAVVAIPLILSVVLFYRQGYQETPVVVSVITPGVQKAILELPWGESVVLSTGTEKEITGKEGYVLGKDSVNILVIQPRGKGDNRQNTIRVPQGGEYRVVLSDGTKVWINSGSELKFPGTFGGKERVVELKGEAYFDVTEDSAHPFVVRTERSAVRVLGTSFNVCSYGGDDFEQMTLESGMVEVDCQGQLYRLEPGEQFEVIASGVLRVREVDVNLFASWKDGMFRFLDMPLDKLMVKLQRWYDVNFFFANENCKTYRFTGAIRKDMNFDEFIKLIETTTKVKFEVNKDHIVIREK